MQAAYREGVKMPFESKKKKYKTPESYRQKSLYLDESNPYQAECLALLELCGHKQAKFLGLLAHSFITRYGIDINRLDKNVFANFVKMLEIQATTGMNPMMAMQPYMPQVEMASANISANSIAPKKSVKKKEIIIQDEFIDEDDMDDMNEALAAFGA